jgi:molybdopterin converting factor subunit 1
MRVIVKLFALAREVYGNDTIAIDLHSGATAGELRNRLALEIPCLAPLMKQVLIAVNTEYASDQNPLSEGDEVACIPPVSGG